jgi:hypothetical protein
MNLMQTLNVSNNSNRESMHSHRKNVSSTEVTNNHKRDLSKESKSTSSSNINKFKDKIKDFVFQIDGIGSNSTKFKEKENGANSLYKNEFSKLRDQSPVGVKTCKYEQNSKLSNLDFYSKYATINKNSNSGLKNDSVSISKSKREDGKIKIKYL